MKTKSNRIRPKLSITLSEEAATLLRFESSKQNKPYSRIVEDLIKKESSIDIQTLNLMIKAIELAKILYPPKPKKSTKQEIRDIKRQNNERHRKWYSNPVNKERQRLYNINWEKKQNETKKHRTTV